MNELRLSIAGLFTFVAAMARRRCPGHLSRSHDPVRRSAEPGGANDTIARIVSQKVGTILKQPTIVDNRPGAGGNIGNRRRREAKPDGYTLLFTTNGTQVINPSLYKSPGFDAVKDFIPIATVATAGYVLVANPSFPANNVKDLVAHVKKSPPGSISYAIGRQRNAQPSRLRDVREGGRHPVDARPLQERGGCGDRRRQRPGSALDPEPAFVARLHQDREAEGHRDDQ
jgi:hypothetical protein